VFQASNPTDTATQVLTDKLAAEITATNLIDCIYIDKEVLIMQPEKSDTFTIETLGCGPKTEIKLESELTITPETLVMQDKDKKAVAGHDGVHRVVLTRDAQGRVVDYKRDERGEPVLSRLDEETLGRIALATGGKYFRATDRGTEVSEIAGLVAEMEGKELASKLFTRYEERFYWPLGVAVALLVTDTLIPRRRRVTKSLIIWIRY